MDNKNKYIKVPYEDKDIAKARGAKWDVEKRCWYIPPGKDEALFERWLVSGFGKSGVGGLYVDLVPSSTWYSNLRSVLSKSDWDLVKKKTYKASGYRCQICRGYGSAHPVEAHERWLFDVESRTQTLKCVEALCPACHEATHYGLATVKGRGHIALERLMYVNGWSEREANLHVNQAFELWQELSEIEDWKLDVSWIAGYVDFDDETKQLIQDIKDGVKKRV